MKQLLAQQREENAAQFQRQKELHEQTRLMLQETQQLINTHSRRHKELHALTRECVRAEAKEG